MNASDDYCDFCDLPRSQCVHGMPPPPPTPVAAPPRPRKRTAAPARASGTPSGTPSAGAARSAPTRPARTVPRRWTPPEAFKPLILEVLAQAGGELDNDDVFLELEILAEDRLLPADNETTPEGELRWRYAARRARASLIAEGLMTKGTPGVWQLAGREHLR